MIKVISQFYYFSHMRKKVKDYVSKYKLCHKIKLIRNKSYREREIRTLLTLS